ncbi:gliding motility-associated C-terminal domain-containing protein [Mucilaginibacter sp. HMF5004]|uniref:PKD domain-containing protein n=1 Tax=Mucilaginibacter rivuli TaxID=2857527 RepID=UPI001C6076E7|nr:PKD domain-containing protein [Mucilaginibacter rivuli]MBW4888859.1 gliding motility-associated C-terminal domain-containing protein [Mucilaginibacter rivuli]
MKILYLFFLSLFLSCAAFAQAPVNDAPTNATLLPIVKSYCSNDGEYTSVKATPFFTNDTNNDVWFKFTAVAFDISITVTASGPTPLAFPDVTLYTYDGVSTYSDIKGSPANGGIVTTYYKGGLTIGQTYYFRVFGAHNSSTGTFKLCVNNYNPILQVGQDYTTASILCSKESFTQTGVSGAGANNRESAGTCLDYSVNGGSIEANTAWYKWTAANNGTLTFTITPTVTAPVADDIDWVLYDLGPTGSAANVTAANAIRCDASRGVDCISPMPNYYKTGLRTGETQVSEPAGCNINFTGFDAPVDMIQGHVYALLINNFSNGNNGVTLDFGGTGEFVGPTSAFKVTGGIPCTSGQIFTFENKSVNYAKLQWTFGENATPATATGNGPFFVTYSTPGQKTAVLEATGAQGCIIVADTTFTVGVTPPKPVITSVKKEYCLRDTMILSTPAQLNYTYLWTGPNNFTSTASTVSIPLTAYNQAGKYVLQVTQFGCASDTASIAIVSIGTKPVDDFTITANNLCTPQQSFTIVNNSTDYTSLQWDYGADANTPTVINANTVNVTYSTYGVKTVTLTATGSQGCITILSKTLTNPMKPATPVISKDKPLYCIGDSITLSIPAQAAGTTYAWSGPNNFTSTKVSPKILATTAAAGTYTLVVTLGLCSSDAATILVNSTDIIPVSVASFTANVAIPSTVYFPDGVSFTNTSTNADSYIWDFGDGTTSTDVNPVHFYTAKGDYTVTLTATNQNTCNNAVSKGKILLRYKVIIFIPNTFTPNNDGINDDFRIKMIAIKTFHMQIFNRYGVKLYDSTVLTDYWKGTYGGSPVPVGAYYYVIDLVTFNDDKLKESGSITVLR